MIDTDPIELMRRTPIGGAAEIATGLHAFRVPKQRFRYGQSYGLLHDGGTILIDAVHEITKPAVDDLLMRHPPKALLITHSDLLEQAFGTPADLSAWLGNLPVLIHSRDGGNLDGLMPLETSTAIMGDLATSFYHVPGHTPGSVAYFHMPTGYLFTGDNIVGNNYAAEEQEFTHVPFGKDQPWYEFVNGWEAIPRNIVNGVFPLHGQPSFGEDSGQAARDAALLRDKVMHR